jgi:hypothetical protein
VNIRTCKERWKVEAGRDGRLTVIEQHLHGLHLEICATCSIERLRLEAIAQMLRRLPLRAPSPFIVRATRRRLLETAGRMLD